jgi:NAD(P)-dependent dehydrogenase (short-subunit alcohol dehydrogenase family)
LNKVAPISGTLTGIRRSTVRAFIRERARVVVFGCRTKSGARAAGVRINAVAPSPADTRMLDRFTGTPEGKAALTFAVPRDRVGKPDDIARTILFLALRVASFVTNRTVTVDGGGPQADEEKLS